MGIIPEQSHLTNPNPQLQEMRQRTAPGMAHFAGTGPEQRVCRECSEWTGCGKENGYYAKKGFHGGMLKPRACSKYRELMGQIGEPIPPTTRACKYFEEAIAPPAISSK